MAAFSARVCWFDFWFNFQMWGPLQHQTKVKLRFINLVLSGQDSLVILSSASKWTAVYTPVKTELTVKKCITCFRVIAPSKQAGTSENTSRVGASCQVFSQRFSSVLPTSQVFRWGSSTRKQVICFVYKIFREENKSRGSDVHVSVYILSSSTVIQPIRPIRSA